MRTTKIEWTQRTICAIIKPSRKQVMAMVIFVSQLSGVPCAASLLSRQSPGFCSQGTFYVKEIQMGSKSGVQKIAAMRVGCSVEEYLAHVELGEKWCVRCKSWHHRSAFGIDKSRSDGLASACFSSRKKAQHRFYQPQLIRMTNLGKRFVTPRDGDKNQARRRVNHLVENGTIPHPNSLPCHKCGHECTFTDGLHHEYHHFKGYSAEHHESVQALCTACHSITHRGGNYVN